ncbi:hypothetical protein OESDEN_14008 [Oesophagostomum dentatum]|uniref:Uncharacterized protein n=1 Tax=Oesophagostomum dentatum TaxID=61180 RepID=A0A0B1SRV0_OESDE|nr:hypothetical protein OESDEN_14008 [Oesophagostomum dentatum]
MVLQEPFRMAKLVLFWINSKVKEAIFGVLEKSTSTNSANCTYSVVIELLLNKVENLCVYVLKLLCLHSYWTLFLANKFLIQGIGRIK